MQMKEGLHRAPRAAHPAALGLAHGAEVEPPHERRVDHRARYDRDDQHQPHQAEEQLAGQAEDLLARDMPVIPLRAGQNNFGHSTRVKNVEMDVFFRTKLLKLEPAAAQ